MTFTLRRTAVSLHVDGITPLWPSAISLATAERCHAVLTCEALRQFVDRRPLSVASRTLSTRRRRLSAVINGP